MALLPLTSALHTVTRAGLSALLPMGDDIRDSRPARIAGRALCRRSTR
jgi:hypothetical protein